MLGAGGYKSQGQHKPQQNFDPWKVTENNNGNEFDPWKSPQDSSFAAYSFGGSQSGGFNR